MCLCVFYGRLGVFLIGGSCITVSRVGDCCHTDLLEKHSPKDGAEALYASTLPMPLTSASLYVFCPEVFKVAVHREISDVNSGHGAAGTPEIWHERSSALPSTGSSDQMLGPITSSSYGTQELYCRPLVVQQVRHLSAMWYEVNQSGFNKSRCRLLGDYFKHVHHYCPSFVGDAG